MLPINRLNRWLAASILLGLVFGGHSSASDFRLEPRAPYTLAKETIPGFPTGPLKENWILSPLPASWKSVSLDGDWKSKFIKTTGFLDYYDESRWTLTPQEQAWVQNEAQTAGWGIAKVPWAIQFPSFPGGAKGGGLMWYARQFAVPPFDASRERLVLRFNGAGFRMDAWINGKPLGSHIGPYVTVDFDVTRFVKPGEQNRVVVRTAESRVGHGFNGLGWYYQAYTGLYAPVELQVRPLVEADVLRLAPKTGQDRLDFDFIPKGSAFGNSPGSLSVEINEWASGKPAFQWKTEAALKDGVRYTGAVAMPAAHCWSPEDPFLYVYSLKWNGMEIARQRFGFREISIRRMGDREHFFLNGKRIYLRMLEFNDLSRLLEPYGITSFSAASAIVKKVGSVNEDGNLRKALLAMKYANINGFRPHSAYAIIDPTFYNLCDELGFIVYMDWATKRSLRLNAADRQEYHYLSVEAQLPLFREVVRQYQNHPSLGLFSFGNELYSFYQHYLPTGKAFSMLIKQYDSALKEDDLQKRPSTGSAGGSTLVDKSPVDAVDTHPYTGVYYGCSILLENRLKETARQIVDVYKKPLPLISSETGFVQDVRQYPEIFEKWGPTLKSPDFDRKAFAEKIKRSEDRGVVWAQVAMNAGGSRCYLTDFPEWRRRGGIRMVKRYFEIYRRNHQLTDGVSVNGNQTCLINYLLKANESELKTEPWPKLDDETLQIALADPIFNFRESFQPLLPIVKVETPHPISGMPFRGELTVVNDSPEDVQCDLTVQVRNPKGELVLKQPPVAVAMKQGGEWTSNLEVPLPKEWTSGWYTLELFLHRGGKVLASNHYDLSVLSDADRIKQFPNGRKLAVYSGEGQREVAMLKNLGIEATSIGSFENLEKFDVLVVGRNAMDVTIHQAGERIRKWLEQGGRLFCFEQLRGKNLPWSPGTIVQRRGTGDFMEMLRPRHPIFKGFDSDMVWDNPPGGIFVGNLRLDESSLAVAAIDKGKGETANIESIVSDVRIGKGESLVSMVDTELFGQDGTVTRYVENALHYILQPEISPDAVSLPEQTPGNLIMLKSEDALFLDLSKAVNRGFSDEVAGDGKGGWTDYGTDDMAGLPTGTTTLNGFVPFHILDPDKNGGRSCLVLRGPTRSDFPGKSQEIVAGDFYGALYFLHTAMHVQKGEVPVVRYVIDYEDGSQAVYEPKNKVDLADWFGGGELQNAEAVFVKDERRIYLSVWKNPSPQRKIKSIRMESTGKAIPILIAITGSKPDINLTQ